jgi:hypothetical protein
MKVPHCCALVALIWILDVSVAEAQCTYSVLPTTFSVPSTVTSRTITIITGTACSWTATSAASWMTITSASGSGTGSAVFLVDENPTTSSRTGTLTVAGQTITVTQGVGSCSYTVTPPSFAIGSASATRTITIITGLACSWTATSATSWITITGGASGTGQSFVSFSVAANATDIARTGTIATAGQTVTVNQAAGSGGTPPVAPTGLRIVY